MILSKINLKKRTIKMADNLTSKEYTPQELKGRGFKFECGFEILMASNIPAGGGISSSSALECGFAFAVIDTFIENVQNAYVKAIGYKAGFFVCETGDGVSLL